MMLKRALIVAGIAALFAGGFPPAGDACAMPAGDHACCAHHETEAADSCCASSAPAESADGVGCGCTHHPETTAVVSASASAQDANHDASLHLSPSRALIAAGFGHTRHPIGSSFRAHPPPPVFLIDCAFLT